MENRYDKRRKLIEAVLEQECSWGKQDYGLNMAAKFGYLLGYLIGSMTDEQEKELQARLKPANSLHG